MHILPLPFGLVLALIPRREADRLRGHEPLRHGFEKTIHAREKIRGDIRRFDGAGRHIL